MPQVGALSQTRFCLLFHDIFVHQLHCDVEAASRIGEIQVDVTFSLQRMIYLDKRLLPRKRKESYPRSIFARGQDFQHRFTDTYDDHRYACRLNQCLLELRNWIYDQARRCEEEYRKIGGRDGIVDDATYEDYEITMDISGVLGENHPEYDDNDDNIVVYYTEPVYKKNQYIFGRSRNPLHDKWIRFSGLASIDLMTPCGLLCTLWDALSGDWLKILSIGGFWCNVNIIQRRIVRF